MNFPLQDGHVVSIFIFILFIQIELTAWEPSTFTHRQHLNQYETEEFLIPSPDMLFFFCKRKSEEKKSNKPSVTLSLSELVFLVFWSSFSPSICLVNMGRAFLKRSSKLNASRTCTAHRKMQKVPDIYLENPQTKLPLFPSTLQSKILHDRHFTCSFSLLEVRIMEATTSGRVSLGKLSSSRLNLATTGTDVSNMPNNYRERETDTDKM